MKHKQNTTLRELARMVGVSTSTASRALNHNSAISEDVRKRVLRAAQETNYIPNSLARGLALKRSHLIGLVVPSIANPFFAEIARGAHDAAYEKGYVVTLCDTQRSKGREELFTRTLLRSRVDGVIVTGGGMSPENFQILKEQNLPVVLAGRRSTGNGESGVGVDNVVVGHEATQYLIRKGHEKILYLSGPPDSPASKERQRGYTDAMEAHRLTPAVVRGDFSMESGFHEAARIAGAKARPTAVFAANDMLAIGLIMGLVNLGLKVPDHIAVVGSDDIPMGALIKPLLTTVRVPMYEIGVRAMELLLHSIEDEGKRHAESILMDCQLVVRESAG
ncbi:MAG TPA: LacI family DNA-binding transcriptional regulator [Bryobacteraceae bacterium]|nr:LacI family DNA-binding transcriptional regulator [Bryobacteraceae bacterium]